MMTYCASVSFATLLAIIPIAARAAESPKNDAGPIQYLSVSEVDVGVTYPLVPLQVTSTLTNTSTVSIRVDRVEPRSSGGNPELSYKPTDLRPGQSLDVRVKLTGDDRAGRFSYIFLAFSNQQKEPVGKIAIRGFVDWVVDPESAKVDVGFRKAQEEFERKLVLRSRPGTNVRLNKISRQSKWLVARIVDDGNALSVSNVPGMPWGPFDELVVADTDNALQQRVGFRIKGEIRGSIVPSMDVVDFGVVREGESAEQIVRLVDESGRKINVGKIKVDGAVATATLSDCVPAADACKFVKLVLGERKMGAALRGLMKIDFPDYKEGLSIPFGGALIGKDTVIRDLADAAKAAEASPASVSAALKSSIQSRKPVEMANPDGNGPLLKWETANESAIYGYEIYRSSTPSGVFARVNASILAKLSQDPAIGSVYRWRDSTAKVGHEYWYYIGVVKLDGRKEPLNSPQKVVPQ